jgi:hypothetical protein
MMRPRRRHETTTTDRSRNLFQLTDTSGLGKVEGELRHAEGRVLGARREVVGLVDNGGHHKRAALLGVVPVKRRRR